MKINRSVNSIAFLNIFSVVILQGIAFLSIPIFSRMLGTEQYGQYSVFNSWVTIVTCFMGLGMSFAIGTGKYHFKEEYEKFKSCILLYGFLVSLVEGGLILLCVSIAGSFSHLSTTVFLYVIILSVSHFVVNFAQNTFIYEKKALYNFILSTVTAFSTTLLSIYLVWSFPAEDRYIGRVYGMMLPYAFIAIGVLIIFLSRQKIVFKKSFLVFGFQVGFPIIFHSLSQTLLAQSDRVMMQMMDVSDSEIGIYSLFYTLISVLTVILNALNNTWCPFYYDNLSNDEYDTIKDKTNNYIELFSILTFGFLMLSPEVSLIMADNSYSTGIKIIPIIVSSVYFTFMYQFPVNYEFYNKKTKIIASGTVGAAIINIILNFILIPVFGMYGAALATSISYLALFLVHYCIVNRLKDLKRFHTKATVFFPSILFVCSGIFIFYLLNDNWLIRWTVGIVFGVFELFRIFRRKSIF